MPMYFQFRVSLSELRPLIWRRFLLMRSATFADLHAAIQAAGPWEGRHPYLFRGKRSDNLIVASDDSESRAKLLARPLKPYFGEAPGGRCYYVYDLGDAWVHEVRSEGVVQHPERFERRLLDGARAFPKDGMGGTDGYMRSITAPSPARWKWLRGWDPEFFDIEIAKDIFDRPRKRASSARSDGG